MIKPKPKKNLDLFVRNLVLRYLPKHITGYVTEEDMKKRRDKYSKMKFWDEKRNKPYKRKFWNKK